MEEDKKIRVFLPTYEDMKQPAVREKLDQKFHQFVLTLPDTPFRNRIIAQHEKDKLIDYDIMRTADLIKLPYWEQLMDAIKDINNRMDHATDSERPTITLEQDLVLRLMQVIQLWHPEDPDYTRIGEHKDGR